jgi:hypothetical protein
MRVFVTGSRGLIGRRLVSALLARGDAVVPLSRRPMAPDQFGPGEYAPMVGDPTQIGTWQQVAQTCDAVVHLAGEPILAERWSPAFLERFRFSRVASTRLIAETLAQSPTRVDGTPKVFVSASAVGYYGADTGDVEITEDHPAGTDLMADVCLGWEAAATPARWAQVRVCHPRIGIVFDPEGGALPAMARPFRWWIGGRIGSGRQFVSWIHHADLIRLLLFALDTPSLVGPFNATAPNPVTNAELSRTLANVLRRWNWLPVPKFALRILMGKAAEVVAGGQRAVPKRVKDLGFSFQYPTLEPALRELFER